MNLSSVRSSWPVMGGIALLLAGLCMLGGAAFFHHRAQHLVASTTNLPARELVAAVGTQSSAVEDFARQLPAHDTHLDDASLIFSLATQEGVTLGPMNYRTEANPSLPVVVRLVDVRLDADYPKLKSFVAMLLRKLPHLYLEEIRVEQGSAPGARMQATLKLSLLYQAERAGSR